MITSKVKFIISKLVIYSFVILSSTAYCVEGWNMIYSYEITGTVNNYQNLGCLIKMADELFLENYYAEGGFYADGDEAACLSLCAYWKDTFTKSSKGSSVNWENKVFRTYPNGFLYTNYQNGMKNPLTAKYVCKAEYSPTFDGTQQQSTTCLPDVYSKVVCNPTSVTYPLPKPTCKMTLDKTVGIPTTTFKISDRSASSIALSCELQHHGVNSPIECIGSNYTLSKDLGTVNSVGTHSVKFIAKGFGGDATCSSNYTVYNPVSCKFNPSSATLTLSADTQTTINWSSSGDISKCDYYKDGTLMTSDILCSGTVTTSAKALFSSTGTHNIELRVKGKGGDTASCKETFTVK